MAFWDRFKKIFGVPSRAVSAVFAKAISLFRISRKTIRTAPEEKLPQVLIQTRREIKKQAPKLTKQILTELDKEVQRVKTDLPEAKRLGKEYFEVRTPAQERALSTTVTKPAAAPIIEKPANYQVVIKGYMDYDDRNRASCQYLTIQAYGTNYPPSPEELRKLMHEHRQRTLAWFDNIMPQVADVVSSDMKFGVEVKRLPPNVLAQDIEPALEIKRPLTRTDENDTLQIVGRSSNPYDLKETRYAKRLQ